MRLIISREEFMALRDCVVTANTQSVTDGFNSLFSGEVPEIKVTTEGNYKILDVEGELAIDLINIVGKNFKSSGKTVMGFVKATPTTLLTGLSIFKELKAKITERRGAQ